MSNIEIEVSADQDFTILRVTENGQLIARYSIENFLVEAVYAALCAHLGVGSEEEIYFFPVCDGCPSEADCLERGSCFFERGYDCEM